MSDTPATGDASPDEEQVAESATSSPVRDEARRLWTEEKMSARRIAGELGLHHGTIARWVKEYEWQRPSEQVSRPRTPSDDELEEAAKRAQRAADHARTQWAMRRADEATQAGITASIIRQRLIATIGGTVDAPITGKVTPEDALTAQRLSTAYATFIDKAQVLSGGMTGALAVGIGRLEPHEPERTPEDVAERAHRQRLALVPDYEEVASGEG